MWAKLQSLLLPFSAIASELRILRELYELELAERTPPIRRVTEKPGRSDTTVTYMGVEDRVNSKESVLVEDDWDEEADGQS